MEIDLFGLLAALIQTIEPARDTAAACRALEDLLAARLELAAAHVFALEPHGDLLGGERRVPRDAPLGVQLRATERVVRAPASAHLLEDVARALAASGVSQIVGVPLVARGTLRGVAVLAPRAGSPASRLADEPLLALGGALAVALEQARAVEATRLRAEVDRALLDAARFATTTTDLAAVLDRHAEALARIARATRCGIALPDPAGDKALLLRAVYAATPEDAAALEGLRLDRDATVIAQAWISKRLVVVERESARSASTRRFLGAVGGRTLAALPLVAGGLVRGIAFLAREGEIDEETRGLLEAIGHEAALAIGSIEEREAARRASERATIEAHVRSSVNESFDLDRILAGAVERLGRALHANRCVIGLPDDGEPPALRFVHEYRDPPTLPSALAWKFASMDRPVIRAVNASHGPLVTSDNETDPRVGGMAKIAPADWRAGILASFDAGRIVRGGLLVGDLAPRRWTEDEVRLVCAIAEQCAIAVGRARLHDDGRARADELEKVVSQMTDGLVIVNERLEVVRMNGAARQILFGRTFEGLHLSATLGHVEVQDTDHRTLALEELPLVRAATKGETTRNSQVILRERATGKEKWLSCSASALDDGAGRRLGALCVFRDVTDARAAAEHASRTEKLRVVGELAASVAHELNNTLAAVLGRAEFIQSTTAEGDTRRNADVIASAARDATVVLGRLTRLSHKPGPASTLGSSARSRVDLLTVVNDAVELTRPRWSRIPRVTVSLSAGSDRVLTHGVATELREVFTNLLLNAVAALSEGGSVRISVGAEAGHACVRVVDTGCGMSEAVLGRAFEPFFTTKGEEGTGLGLNICSAIVTAHQGRIEARSTPGVGTTIEVALPLADDTETPRQPTTTPPPLRLLVVDDDPRVLSVLADVLAHEGHAVETAKTGEEALALFLAAHEKPRVLVTDISMPGMSGVHLAEEVVTLAPETAIVLVSGWAGSVANDDLVRLGATMVTKPFVSGDVRTAIARSLATRPAPPR